MKHEILEIESDKVSLVLKINNQIPNLTEEKMALLRRILGRTVEKLNDNL